MMNDRELERRARHRLAVFEHAEEMILRSSAQSYGKLKSVSLKKSHRSQLNLQQSLTRC